MAHRIVATRAYRAVNEARVPRARRSGRVWHPPTGEQTSLMSRTCHQECSSAADRWVARWRSPRRVLKPTFCLCRSSPPRNNFPRAISSEWHPKSETPRNRHAALTQKFARANAYIGLMRSAHQSGTMFAAGRSVQIGCPASHPATEPVRRVVG